MDKTNTAFWVVLSVIGVALTAWGISSGSLPFTLAPAVVTVGCIAMALSTRRKTDPAGKA